MPERVTLPPHEICPPRKDPSGQDIRLSIADLLPADVLLSYTEGGDGLWVPSWWVRAIEKGCYSHAALYDGHGCVIEAKSPSDGVVESTLPDKPYQYADVFRYQWTEPVAPDARQAVVESARKLVGKSFGVGNAILVGLLALTRRVNLPGRLEDSLRTVLDTALSVLTEIVRDGRDFIICSELVYVAYADTGNRLDIGPLHPRAPEAILAALREADETAKSPEASAIQARLSSMAELYLSCRDRHRAVLAGVNKAADVPDFVTPLDLQRSPSLERVGRLDLGSARSSPDPRGATKR